jgi:hypothetical protein
LTKLVLTRFGKKELSLKWQELQLKMQLTFEKFHTTYMDGKQAKFFLEQKHFWGSEWYLKHLKCSAEQKPVFTLAVKSWYIEFFEAKFSMTHVAPKTNYLTKRRFETGHNLTRQINLRIFQIIYLFYFYWDLIFCLKK